MARDEREGYQFVGWYIDPQYTKRINPGGKLPGTVTLYDKWVPIIYPVRYNCNGGVNSRRNPRYVSVETGVKKLYPAQKKGMRFAGWVLDGQIIEYLPPRITGEITLEAQFRELCTVRFETNGGATIPDKMTDESGFLELFRPPMRMGYEFGGWYLDEKLTFPFEFDMQVNESMTLYAKWNVKLYRIVYHTDGGVSSRTNPKTYSYFDNHIVLSPARKKGYRFIGWFDARGNALDHIRHHSIGDKEFFARFEKEENSD